MEWPKTVIPSVSGCWLPHSSILRVAWLCGWPECVASPLKVLCCPFCCVAFVPFAVLRVCYGECVLCWGWSSEPCVAYPEVFLQLLLSKCSSFFLLCCVVSPLLPVACCVCVTVSVCCVGCNFLSLVLLKCLVVLSFLQCFMNCCCWYVLFPSFCSWCVALVLLPVFPVLRGVLCWVLVSEPCVVEVFVLSLAVFLELLFLIFSFLLSINVVLHFLCCLSVYCSVCVSMFVLSLFFSRCCWRFVVLFPLYPTDVARLIVSVVVLFHSPEQCICDLLRIHLFLFGLVFLLGWCVVFCCVAQLLPSC